MDKSLERMENPSKNGEKNSHLCSFPFQTVFLLVLHIPSKAFFNFLATDKCDIVNLRGEKKEVDKLYVVMTKLTKELELSNYQGSVSIFKDYYKHIIGKSGANINKIREETQTRIELPSGGDGRITGSF